MLRQRGLALLLSVFCLVFSTCLGKELTEEEMALTDPVLKMENMTKEVEKLEKKVQEIKVQDYSEAEKRALRQWLRRKANLVKNRLPNKKEEVPKSNLGIIAFPGPVVKKETVLPDPIVSKNPEVINFVPEKMNRRKFQLVNLMRNETTGFMQVQVKFRRKIKARDNKSNKYKFTLKAINRWNKVVERINFTLEMTDPGAATSKRKAAERAGSHKKAKSIGQVDLGPEKAGAESLVEPEVEIVAEEAKAAISAQIESNVSRGNK